MAGKNRGNHPTRDTATKEIPMYDKRKIPLLLGSAALVLGATLAIAGSSSDRLQPEHERQGRRGLATKNYIDGLRQHRFRVTAQTLRGWVSGPTPPLVVDVRHQAPYQADHIPGAVHRAGDVIGLVGRLVSHVHHQRRRGPGDPAAQGLRRHAEAVLSQPVDVVLRGQAPPALALVLGLQPVAGAARDGEGGAEHQGRRAEQQGDLALVVHGYFLRCRIACRVVPSVLAGHGPTPPR